MKKFIVPMMLSVLAVGGLTSCNNIETQTVQTNPIHVRRANESVSSLEQHKVSYKDMLEEEDAILKQMLEERNLPINSITYGAIREYALVRGIIKHGKLEKNSIR